MKEIINSKHYDNIDGLRTISCIGIIGMHIRACSNYEISGYIFNSIIPAFTNFVYLFLAISGFDMFCGYYNKIKNGEINLDSYYKRRYKKMIPFFAVVLTVDIIFEHKLSSLIEAFTELTLVFGLLPNNRPMGVGIGWTIGVIFLFYILLPFIVFLCWDKKRAILSFAGSIIITMCCSQYWFSSFFVAEGFAPRHNFLYCAPFFFGGGLIYLYKETIINFIKQKRWLCFILIAVATLIYLVVPDSVGSVEFDLIPIKNLAIFIPWIAYSISVDSKLLNNKVMKFLGSISLEMYLGQMLVFRAVEKCGLLYIFGDGWISFLFVWVITVVGLICFVMAYKKTKVLLETLLGKFAIKREADK